VLAAARAHFRPEFLNRLDEIIVFDPLNPAQLLGVARLMAAELAARLAPRGIALQFSEEALGHAAALAFDPAYGARPLRRWLEQRVLTDLSRLIVAGELPDGAAVRVDRAPPAAGVPLSYTVVAAPMAAAAQADGGGAGAGGGGAAARDASPGGVARAAAAGLLGRRGGGEEAWSDDLLDAEDDEMEA